MRGKFKITLSLFGRRTTISTKAAIGSEVTPEVLKYVADELRKELGSPDFPWEKMIESLEPDEAWQEQIAKLGVGPVEKDVHTEHCCGQHRRCKYAYDDCTVANRSKPASYPCNCDHF